MYVNTVNVHTSKKVEKSAGKRSHRKTTTNDVYLTQLTRRLFLLSTWRMEEARALLSSGKWCSLYSVQLTLERLQMSVEKQNNNNEALAMLWALVNSEQAVVAENAVQTILNLYTRSFLSLESCLSGLMSSSSSVVHTNSLLSALSKLLLVSRARLESNPFVKLLKSFPSVWPQLLSHIPSFLNEPSGRFLIEELVVSVYCDPCPKPHLSSFKQSLMDILIEKDEMKEIREKIVPQMLFLTDNSALATEQTCLVMKILRKLSSDCNENLKNLHKCVMVANLVNNGVHVGFVINNNDDNNDDDNNDDNEESNDNNVIDNLCAWILVDSAFSVVSLHQLQPILDLFVSTLLGKSKKKIDVLVCNAFLASILRFLPRCQRLPQIVQERLQILIDFCDDNKNFSNDNVHNNEDDYDLASLRSPLAQTHFVHKAYFRHCLSRRLLKASMNKNEDIMDRLQKSCFGLTTNLILSPLLGLILSKSITRNFDSKMEKCDSNQSTVISAVAIVCSKSDCSTAYIVFAVLLRRLTEEKLDFNLIFALLINMVKLTRLDEALISPVLQLLNTSLKTRSALLPLRTRLLFDLWQVEPRIFPYLLKAIEEKDNSKSYNSSSLLLSQCKVMLELCTTRAHQFGADLLPHLSFVLNLEQNNFDAECTILSVQAIAKLCNEAVIDVDTTLQVIEKKVWSKIEKYGTKESSRIMDALGKLYEVVADLEEEEDEIVEKLQLKVLTSLWERLNETLKDKNNENNETLQRFLAKTLSRFHFKLHQLQMLPQIIIDKLTSAKNNNNDASELTKDDKSTVNSIIPGEFWLLLLLESNSIFEPLVSKCLRDEITDLPRAAYYLSPAMKEQDKEPGDYEYLRNESSILKAIVAVIRAKGPVGKAWTSRIVGNEVMEILLKLLYQKEVQRSLPPLDWGKILLEVAQPRANTKTSDEAKSILLQIAALNCPGSSSASRLVQSRVSAAHLIDSDLQIILQHLYSVVRGVRVASLEHFLATIIDEALVEDDNNVVSYLTNYLDMEKDGEYKTCVFSVLSPRLRLMFDLEYSRFEHFLPLVNRMPKEELEKALDKDLSLVNVNNLCRLKQIRATAIMELMECVDHVLTTAKRVQAREELRKTLLTTLQVFVEQSQGNISIEDSKKWLGELMGRMRSSLRSFNNSSEENKECEMICFEMCFDLFVASCHIFSGCHLANVSLGLALAELFVRDTMESTEISMNKRKLSIHKYNWSSMASALCEFIIALRQSRRFLAPKVINVLDQVDFAFRSCGQQYTEDSIWTRLSQVDNHS